MALLDDIHASPDDDAPRLVYADELIAAGDPRGELITVQCELARLGCGAQRLFCDWIGDELGDAAALADGRIAKLRARESKLLAQHGEAWGKDVRRFTVEKDGVKFRRGFVEHVRWDVARQLDKGIAKVIAAAPLVRAIELASQLPDPHRRSLKRFYAEDAMRRVRELYVQSLDELAAATALDALERLELAHPGGQMLGALADAAFMPHVAELTLSGFAPGVIESLVGAMEHVRELQLITSRLDRDGLEALVGKLARTRVLALRHTSLVRGDLAAALRGRRLGALVALDLRSNLLGAQDLAAIAKLPLRVLDLGNTRLEAGAIAELAGMRTLGSLSLYGAGVRDSDLASLPPVRRLDLRKNAITDEGAATLAAATTLATVYLGGNKLTAKGRRTLQTGLAARIHL